MTIGIDIRTLMDAQYSGVSEYTLNLVKEILRLDKLNSYKLFYNSFTDILSRLPEFNASNAEVIGLNYPNKIINYLYFKIFNSPKIDDLLRVDLFFMPHINFIALSGKRHSLITVHDLSFLRHKEFFSWRKNFWHGMINVKKLLNKFDKIIAVSENTKRDIIELCQISPDKIKVIYSGVGKEYRQISNLQFLISKQNSNINFADQKKLGEVKFKYNLPDKFILYLGTLEPRKNVEGLIRAYAKLMDNNELSNIKLIIAGGLGWKNAGILKEWENAKYKDDIKLLGYIDSVDKPYLYNLASVFVYPSFYEGFGFPPLEAMACGTPVICSFSSSLPEVIGDASLMIDPYNINQIAESMKIILTNQGLKDDLIKKGLARASQFKWDKTAIAYLETFNGLIYSE